MKIAVLIPTRGNRPKLLKNCLRMIHNQTVIPDHIELVDDEPIFEQCDITWRYKLGYDRLRNKGFDIILLIEDDDFYRYDYIETMLNEWVKQGKPDMLGTNYTIYYHIGMFAWFTYLHEDRSSAMSTIIKPDLNFEWCHDNQPYTDAHLWKTLNGITFKPDRHICLGMKHGTTMTGGMHNHISRYINDDSDHKLLLGAMDKESYNFYSNFMKR